MTYYHKFVEMQKMFHGKYVAIAEVQPIIKTQTITADVKVVDVNVNVNVTTRSKLIEEQVFKDKKPRKAKNVID
jgi:hypothetical protein